MLAKRLNLSAFEAIRFGCIPVVDERTCPDVLMDFGLPTYQGILKNKRLLANYSDETNDNLKRYLLREGVFTYDSVKESVEAILTKLKYYGPDK